MKEKIPPADDPSQNSAIAALSRFLDASGVPPLPPKPAFFCSWCNNRGCISCYDKRKKLEAEREAEYKRQFPDGPKPIFTADRNSPEQMEELTRLFGIDAIEKAFAPGGGGIEKLERDAAEAMAKRAT
jgi:hypothetical protein